jgi:hypothetical protein
MSKTKDMDRGMFPMPAPRSATPPPVVRRRDRRGRMGMRDVRKAPAYMMESAGREDGRVRPAFRWRPCRLVVDERMALRAVAGGRIAGDRECEVRGLRHRGRRWLRAA